MVTREETYQDVVHGLANRDYLDPLIRLHKAEVTTGEKLGYATIKLNARIERLHEGKRNPALHEQVLRLLDDVHCSVFVQSEVLNYLGRIGSVINLVDFIYKTQIISLKAGAFFALGEALKVTEKLPVSEADEGLHIQLMNIATHENRREALFPTQLREQAVQMLAKAGRLDMLEELMTIPNVSSDIAKRRYPDAFRAVQERGDLAKMWEAAKSCLPRGEKYADNEQRYTQLTGAISHLLSNLDALPVSVQSSVYSQLDGIRSDGGFILEFAHKLILAYGRRKDSLDYVESLVTSDTRKPVIHAAATVFANAGYVKGLAALHAAHESDPKVIRCLCTGIRNAGKTNDTLRMLIQGGYTELVMLALVSACSEDRREMSSVSGNSQGKYSPRVKALAAAFLDPIGTFNNYQQARIADGQTNTLSRGTVKPPASSGIGGRSGRARLQRA